MGVRGYIPSESKIVEADDVFNSFESDFLKTDLYLPTAHALALNNFPIAETSRVRRIVVSKKIDHPQKEGEKLTVNLVSYFPEMEANTHGSHRLDTAKLESLMCKRRDLRNDPLAVINMSCHSDQVVRSWMDVYRKSLFEEVTHDPIVSDFTLLEDVPVLIGSTRGFNTDSTATLIGHMEYALQAIDVMAEGKKVEDVLELLDQPIDFGEYAFIIEKMDPSSDSSDLNDTNANHGFGPYCNADPSAKSLFDFTKSVGIHLQNIDPDKKDFSF